MLSKQGVITTPKLAANEKSVLTALEKRMLTKQVKDPKDRQNRKETSGKN